MSMVLSTPTQATLPHAPPSGRPSSGSLLRWGALVLVLHCVVLLSLAGTLDWQLSSPQTLRTGPMQTRTITAPGAAPTTTDASNVPAARTRIALVEKPQPAPPPKRDTPKRATRPQTAPAEQTNEPAAPPEWPQKSEPDTLESASLGTPEQMREEDPVNLANEDPNAGKAPETAEVSQALDTPATDPPPAVTPSALPIQSAPLTGNAASPSPVQEEGPPAPERIASATLALPELALASLPPSALLSYRLSGQEKGINYQASGELRWQRNDSAYAMSLTVKAFLLGSRHWRSVGQINATGLAPTRFSDSWRSERAAHFDRPNQRIVFSSNAPAAPLQPGAQDQVSLYVQLAAAMAQSGQQMPPGTRLQIQTATVRDALPWLLTLEKLETLQIDGQSVESVKWVCQPRNRFDAQVEFWVSAAHDWLPARIRITQVSGSFIDLQLTGREALADLPPVQ